MTNITEYREIKLRLEPQDIYYVTWILDGTESIGFLQTDDGQKGLVTVVVPETQLEYFNSLIENLINIEKLKIEIM